MKIKRIAVIAVCCAALMLLVGQVVNQGIFRTGSLPVAGNCVKWSGPNSIADAGAPCGQGGGGSACTAGAIDLSLTTGCNVPFYLSLVFP